jgi:hypothetical protein
VVPSALYLLLLSPDDLMQKAGDSAIARAVPQVQKWDTRKFSVFLDMDVGFLDELYPKGRINPKIWKSNPGGSAGSERV